MNVKTQRGEELSMKEWTKYYESEERDRLLNVISLEFSHTSLDNYVEQPDVVRDVILSASVITCMENINLHGCKVDCITLTI